MLYKVRTSFFFINIMLRLVVLVCVLSLGNALKFGFNFEMAPALDPDIQAAAQNDQYEKFSIYPVPLNWYQAYALCKLKDQELASFETEEDYNFINSGDQSTDYWTSGNDLGEKGKYIWFNSGEPITLWSESQPSAEGEEARCVALKGGLQYLSVCDQPKNVICQKDLSTRVIYV